MPIENYLYLYLSQSSLFLAYYSLAAVMKLPNFRSVSVLAGIIHASDLSDYNFQSATLNSDQTMTFQCHRNDQLNNNVYKEIVLQVLDYKKTQSLHQTRNVFFRNLNMKTRKRGRQSSAFRSNDQIKTKDLDISSKYFQNLEEFDSNPEKQDYTYNPENSELNKDGASDQQREMQLNLENEIDKFNGISGIGYEDVFSRNTRAVIDSNNQIFGLHQADRVSNWLKKRKFDKEETLLMKDIYHDLMYNDYIYDNDFKIFLSHHHQHTLPSDDLKKPGLSKNINSKRLKNILNQWDQSLEKYVTLTTFNSLIELTHLIFDCSLKEKVNTVIYNRKINKRSIRKVDIVQPFNTNLPECRVLMKVKSILKEFIKTSNKLTNVMKNDLINILKIRDQECHME